MLPRRDIGRPGGQMNGFHPGYGYPVTFNPAFGGVFPMRNMDPGPWQQQPESGEWGSALCPARTRRGRESIAGKLFTNGRAENNGLPFGLAFVVAWQAPTRGCLGRLPPVLFPCVQLVPSASTSGR